MGHIPEDRFAQLQPWWSFHNEHLFAETPVVTNGYLRMRCTTGGGAGSFLFNDNDSALAYIVTLGDFDVIADMQCLNAAENDLPAAASAQMFALTCQSPVLPERPEFAAAGYNARINTHRGPGYAPGGTPAGSSARLMSEWKATEGSPGTSSWNTFDGQDVRTAAEIGAGFDDVGGRWWIRMRRQGQVFTTWDLPHQARVPTASAAWTNQEAQTVASMPELTWLGFSVYSSSAAGDVTGRCRAFLNTPQ